MADDILLIRFGVEGGGSISGDSGKRIAGELSAIAKQISPGVRFRLADDQANTFQAELNAIAKGLKLNIEANVTKINMPADARGGTGGTRRTAGAGGNGGPVETTKIRAARMALQEYRKTVTSIIALEKKLLLTQTSGNTSQAEESALKRKIALLKDYARQQAAIVQKNGSKNQKYDVGALNIPKQLKEEANRYDVVIQKVKEYQRQLASLQKTYSTSDYENNIKSVAKDLTDSASNPSLTPAQQSERIAQAQQLQQTYQELCTSIKAVNAALSTPATKFKTDDEARDYIRRISQQLDAAKQKVEAFQQSFRNASKTLGHDVEGLRISREFANASKSAEEFYAKYQRLIRANSEFSQKWSELLAKLRGEEFKSPKEAVIAVRNLITETTRAGLTVETFGQKLRRVFGEKFVAGVAALAGIALRRALRDVYKNVVELDDALTEFSIVSGKTGRDLNDFADKAFESAKRIRAGVTDVVDAATVYSRLGFSDKESLQYAELTTMFSKVGNVDISDAESNITALIKAYDIGADQLELALDKIVKTGNNFAISSAEIGEGLNNAAASLAANGNTLEQSIALLTAAQVVTQNASKSSTALRTIAARLTNSKAELDELGESTDDLVGSTSKYRKELLALTGVDIQDQNGQFRSTYDILKAIADQWERIGRAGNQEAVATLVAGTRQQSVFYSIMQNFQDAMDAMSQMEGAGGTMSESYATYIESISGHLEQIKTTFAELSKDILSSDLVKTVLNIANGLLKIVDYLAKTKALIPAIIAGFASYKLTKGAGIFQIADGKLVSQISKLKTQLQGVWSAYNSSATKAGSLTKKLQKNISKLSGESVNLRGYLTSLGGKAEASFGGYIGYLIKAKAKTIALSAATAVLNAALTLGISLLAGFAYEQITEAIHAAQDAREAAADSAKEVDSLQASLTDLTEQYKKLYTETGGTWDTESLDSVKSIQQQIVDLVGDQAGGINLVNGKLEDQLDILRSISVEQSRTWIRDNEGAIQSSKKYLEKQRTSYLNPGGTLSSNPAVQWARAYLARNAQFDIQSTGQYEISGTADEIIDAYTRMYDELDRYARENHLVSESADLLREISNAINAVKSDKYTAATQVYDSWLKNEAVVSQSDVLKTGFADQGAFDEYISNLRNATDITDDLKAAMIEVVRTAFPEFTAASRAAASDAARLKDPLTWLIDQYATLSKNDQNDASGAIYDTTGQIDEFCSALGDAIDQSEALSYILDGMSVPDVLEYLSGKSAGSSKNLTEYFDALSEVGKMQKLLYTAQNELVSDQSLSASTANEVYTTLTAAGANYLDYLIIEGDQIKLNTELYREFIRQQAYERSGVPELTRALADQLALEQQIQILMQKPVSQMSMSEAVYVSNLKQQLASLREQYGDVEQLSQAIELLEQYFNLSWDKNGLDGLNSALRDTESNTSLLQRAIESLRENGNLDDLTKADFTSLLSQFPKLKRALNDYSKGLISSTKLMEIFQQTLDGIDAENTFTSLGTAKDSIAALGNVVKELNDGGGVSFSSLEKIQGTFGNVTGIDTYIERLKDAKTYTEDVSDVIGTLLYQSLVDAMGSTQALADTDETLIAMMLKEAGVANAAVVAHRAVAHAKQDSEIASKAMNISASTNIAALIAEGVQCGYTKEQLYSLYATQIIFNNTNMNVSQKIAALGQLAQACGIAIGSINGVNGAIAGIGPLTASEKRTINLLVETKQAANYQAAEQMLLQRRFLNNVKSATAQNPFTGIDFSNLGGGGGGGSSQTKAEQIKSAFDDLNSSIEHAIYLEQQYYNVADSEYNYDAMKQSLQNQVGYYKQIQAAAESAMEQVRAYYKAKGMSDAMIEQQSEIQALQKAWWDAANSINESLDKIATAVRDKLSKEIDDIQSAWSSLQKAAEEYSSTGVISIDSLQAIISAGVEYVALLKDENGQLVLNEDAVASVLEAKTQQLAVESALSYVEQVRNALMQNNITELNRLLDVTSVTANSTWDLVYAQAALLNLNSNQYNQLITNINKFRSLATTAVSTIRKQVHNSVKNETKDYKSALDGVLKLVMDLIKYEHEQMVDALEDQRDAYQEIIDKKKELLQQTRDEEDYESNVSKKLKEISRIQDQINRLSLDDSREAAAKRAQLEEELAELQEGLASYIGDYTSSKNEETLDKAADDYSKYIDDRIKKVEEEISSEEKLYRLAIARINSDWDGLYRDILDWNYKAGLIDGPYAQRCAY